MQAKSVNAGQGIEWFKCGWNLFKQDFGTWLIMFILFIVLSIVLSFIPIIGSMLLMLISPALMAGFMYAASEMSQGSSINIAYLFQGFKDKEHRNKLLILGAIYLLAQVIVMAIMVAFIGGSAVMIAEPGQMDTELIMTSGKAFLMLLAFLIWVIVMFGFIYAAPLVMFDKLSPVESIKASYSASFKNVLSLLVFGLIYLLLAVVAAIPFGLGFLILIPVSILALYCSYKSIFH